MTKWLRMLAIAGILTLSTTIMPAQSNSGPQDHWVATWATSEQMAVTAPDRPVLPPNIKMPDFRHMKGVHGPPAIPAISNNQTVRMIVHTSTHRRSYKGKGEPMDQKQRCLRCRN